MIKTGKTLLFISWNVLNRSFFFSFVYKQLQGFGGFFLVCPNFLASVTMLGIHSSVVCFPFFTKKKGWKERRKEIAVVLFISRKIMAVETDLFLCC